MRPNHRCAAQTPERLAYWYFRLNGFLTIENFLVHPDKGSEVRTDVDLLATRFSYRRENVITPMEDDCLISECQTFANVVLAEIKRGRCSLNGPWTNSAAENMERVLRAIGCVNEDEINDASQSLYQTGKWSQELVTIRLFSLGERANPELLVDRSQQIEWTSIIAFCIRRFKAYEQQKSSNGQWASDGVRFRDLALREDVQSIRDYFGLRPCVTIRE